MVLEIDVQPLASGVACFLRRDVDQLAADSTPTSSGGDHYVLDPGVDKPVPDDVDEADQVQLLRLRDAAWFGQAECGEGLLDGRGQLGALAEGPSGAGDGAQMQALEFVA